MTPTTDGYLDADGNLVSVSVSLLYGEAVACRDAVVAQFNALCVTGEFSAEMATAIVAFARAIDSATPLVVPDPRPTQRSLGSPL